MKENLAFNLNLVCLSLRHYIPELPDAYQAFQQGVSAQLARDQPQLGEDLLLVGSGAASIPSTSRLRCVDSRARGFKMSSRVDSNGTIHQVLTSGGLL